MLDRRFEKNLKDRVSTEEKIKDTRRIKVRDFFKYNTIQ